MPTDLLPLGWDTDDMAVYDTDPYDHELSVPDADRVESLDDADTGYGFEVVQ